MSLRTIQQIADIFATDPAENKELVMGLVEARTELQLDTVDNYRHGGLYSLDDQKDMVKKYNTKNGKEIPFGRLSR